MSVDIIQPFFSPQFKKRACDTISLASDGSSKCAEIFVTNNADKWTFFCAFCQKATCDIGAFICHIRLEHLNFQRDLSESQRTSELKTTCSLLNDNNLIPPMTTIHTACAKGAQEPLQRNVIKEELAVSSKEGPLQIICSNVSKIAAISLSNHPKSIETDNLLANKNSVARINRSNEIQDQYGEFETLHESIINSDFANVNKLDTLSCYSLSDDETCFESNACNRASGSKPHKRRRTEIPSMTTMHTTAAMGAQEPLHGNIIQEEKAADSNEDNLQIICSKVSQVANITLSKHPESIETDNFLANKNSVATTNRSNEIQDQLSEFETLHESVTNNDFANVIELDTLSCYSLSDDETCFESNAYNTVSGSKQIPDVTDSGLLHYKCPVCNHRFKTKQAAVHHILYSHDENHHKLSIKCGVCHRVFHTASGLKVHIKSHKKNYLQCPVCPSKLNDRSFITHVLMHESDTCFPCQVCGKVHNSHDERMRHWETHAKEKPFYCKICYRRYSKQYYLKLHLIKSHSQYQCNFCPIEFVSTEVQRAPYVCASCEKLPDIKHLRSMAYQHNVPNSDEHILATFNPSDGQHDEKSMDSKQILLFSNTNNETRDEPYNDSTTHCSFSANEQMNNDDDDDELLIEDGSDLEFVDETCDVPSGSVHNISQLGEDSTYKCLYCYRVFKSRNALGPHLKCHINTDHDRLRFKCSYCNRCFQTKSSLMFHYKTHDINKYQFKCPICSFSGYREGDFINHMLTHEDESCFPCQVCGKILPTNEERLAHWKTHQQEKPHGCKFCYRRFTLKRLLHRHMETHIEYTK